LSEEKPDVILLDFMMPILGGAEMLRAMALDPACHSIPVIMISSLREDVIAEKCKGYAAFLHKPFRAAAVLSIVARVLGRGTKRCRLVAEFGGECNLTNEPVRSLVPAAAGLARSA
jgi:CheY-like chemotaxis protein